MRKFLNFFSHMKIENFHMCIIFHMWRKKNSKKKSNIFFWKNSFRKKNFWFFFHMWKFFFTCDEKNSNFFFKLKKKIWKLKIFTCENWLKIFTCVTWENLWNFFSHMKIENFHMWRKKISNKKSKDFFFEKIVFGKNFRIFFYMWNFFSHVTKKKIQNFLCILTKLLALEKRNCPTSVKPSLFLQHHDILRQQPWVYLECIHIEMFSAKMSIRDT